MNKLQKRVQQRGQGGFTLIELLVVIAILAILAGVVVFAVGNSSKNAEVSACKTERASIVTAIAAARTANLVNDANSKEGIADYLSSDLTKLSYFTVTGGTVTQGTPDVVVDVSATTRKNTTNVAPTGAGCDVLTAAEMKMV